MANEPMNNDPLNLRSLPQLDPPDGLWSDISDALDRRKRPTPPKRGWAPLAMAASVAALALCIALLRPADLPDPTGGAANQLVRLQAVSAALESQLDAYRDGVVSATTVDVIARMEQELAWLDAELSETPDDPALWAERIALLGEMNQRYLRADWRTELMLASY
jgi:hypothetical protein